MHGTTKWVPTESSRCAASYDKYLFTKTHIRDINTRSNTKLNGKSGQIGEHFKYLSHATSKNDLYQCDKLSSTYNLH